MSITTGTTRTQLAVESAEAPGGRLGGKTTVTQSSTPEASVRPRGQRVEITCERCGKRHSLARRLTEPETVYIVCHECEASLRADHPGLTDTENDRGGEFPPPRAGEEDDGTAR